MPCGKGLGTPIRIKGLSEKINYNKAYEVIRMLVEPGRVCIKKFGRDAGSRAVITSVSKDGFVTIVTTKRQKERKCNTKHLEFLNETVDAKNQEQVNKVLGISNAPKKQPRK
ncbi:MAG: hypothetical protein M1544_01495 [Candidatus Marsarchaeota archaeon]|nr:hypothetical protein [Candidatus Marsarchaeota archaeon]MCL5102012.1 hypothetical protein [Candidatus Marsarchaeota archaeon]